MFPNRGNRFSVRDVGVGESQDFREVGGRDLDLVANLARAEEDRFEVRGGFVDHGPELLFHADGRTAAVDVSGEGKEFLRLDHFDGFPVYGFRGFLEVELGVDRDDEDEVFAGSFDRDERLEDAGGVLTERGGDFEAGDRAGIEVAVMAERDFRLFQDAHNVCFELGWFAHDESPSRRML